MRALLKTHFLYSLAIFWIILITPWQQVHALSNPYIANGEVIIKNQQACFYANQPTKPIYGMRITQAIKGDKQYEMLTDPKIAGNSPQNCITLPYDFALDTPYFVVFDQHESTQSTARFCLRKNQEQNIIATFVKHGQCSNTVFNQTKLHQTQRQTSYAYIGIAAFFWSLVLIFRLPKKRKIKRKKKVTAPVV